jgi:uncharacterized protein YndB with AHSA1/START domain
MRFSNTITIDRPASAVFAYLAELENLPRWNYAISETHKLTTWCAIEVRACWPGRSGLGGGQRRAARSETSPAMARWVWA